MDFGVSCIGGLRQLPGGSSILYPRINFKESYFIAGLQAEYRLGATTSWLKDASLRVNVTNLFDEKGANTIVVGANSGTYNTYPIPPRMVFVTLSASF